MSNAAALSVTANPTLAAIRKRAATRGPGQLTDWTAGQPVEEVAADSRQGAADRVALLRTIDFLLQDQRSLETALAEAQA